MKLFAGLREKFGFADKDIVVGDGQTVTDVWVTVSRGGELPGSVLMAVNMDYVKPDARVQDGDEVAFFPPVTGG